MKSGNKLLFKTLFFGVGQDAVLTIFEESKKPLTDWKHWFKDIKDFWWHPACSSGNSKHKHKNEEINAIKSAGFTTIKHASVWITFILGLINY